MPQLLRPSFIDRARIPATADKIGVCVLAYNSLQLIAPCLRALLGAFPDEMIEIVCVDNDSAVSPRELIERDFPQVRFIRNPSNLGYSAGNNIGARYLLDRGCAFIAFVNPDVAVLPSTLQEMRAVLNLHPGFACTGGCEITHGAEGGRSFRNRPGFLDIAIVCGSLRNLPLLRFPLAPLYRFLCSRHYLPSGLVARGQPVYAVAGPCILFRASAFATIGGFDERSFMYAEEFMVAESMLDAGFKIVAAPGAAYDHVGGGSSLALTPRFSLFLSRQFAHSTFVYLWHYRSWRFRAVLISAIFFFERISWFVLGSLKSRLRPAPSAPSLER